MCYCDDNDRYLDKLNRAQAAYTIVRENHSAKGAQMIAEYCRANGNTAGAIEFLLMSKRAEEAFEEASSHDAVNVYVEVLGKNGSPEQYIQIARYYERKKDWGNAGRFHAICGQYSKALNYFLMCGEEEMPAAIDVVGKARSTVMTNTLIDFLMGDADGQPKDPHYIFQLYMALGNYVQASNTAIIIARQEQDSGNYGTARRMLYDTYKDLQDQRIRIPQGLAQALLIVHSYLMAKEWMKLGDHETASRLLTRVAKNVSKFPNNKVGILTSAVIECKRANRDATAFSYASMLMQKDMRESINEKYKRSIEKLVRKRPKNKDPDEITSPCPHCWAMVPNSTLRCDGCKNRIPYCIISGMHMIFNDWSCCPGCRFPAKYSVFTSYIEKQEQPECPLCSHRIVPGTIVKVKDPKPELTAYMQHFEETAADKAGNAGGGDGDGAAGGGEDGKSAGAGSPVASGSGSGSGSSPKNAGGSAVAKDTGDDDK
jgi:WD repeat-containing protein 19